jgi:hypothetical protein
MISTDYGGSQFDLQKYLNTLDIVPSAAYHHQLLPEYATYHSVSIKIWDDNKYKVSLDKKSIEGQIESDF